GREGQDRREGQGVVHAAAPDPDGAGARPGHGVHGPADRARPHRASPEGRDGVSWSSPQRTRAALMRERPFSFRSKSRSARVAGGDFRLAQGLALVTEARNRPELGDDAAAGARSGLAGPAGGGAGVAFAAPSGAVDDDAARRGLGGVRQDSAGGGGVSQGGSGREKHGGDEKSTHERVLR